MTDPTADTQKKIQAVFDKCVFTRDVSSLLFYLLFFSILNKSCLITMRWLLAIVLNVHRRRTERTRISGNRSRLVTLQKKEWSILRHVKQLRLVACYRVRICHNNGFGWYKT